MGAKIEICYLSDKSNESIIVDTLSALFKLNINYNGFIQGEYSYWIDGPIWKFGESRVIKEQSSGTFKRFIELSNIVNILSSNFSPTITLGACWYKKPLALHLSIYENERDWKEVKISIDRYEAIDSHKIDGQKINIENIQTLFYEIAVKLKPYYGVAATEIMGLVDSPEKLQLDNYAFGDLNYFDKASASRLKLSDLKNDFLLNRLYDGSIFLFRKQGIFELG